jgi:hypothetical protein
MKHKTPKIDKKCSCGTILKSKKDIQTKTCKDCRCESDLDKEYQNRVKYF